MPALAMRRIGDRCKAVAAVSVVMTPVAAGVVFAMLSVLMVSVMMAVMMTVMVAVVPMVNHWGIVQMRTYHYRRVHRYAEVHIEAYLGVAGVRARGCERQRADQYRAEGVMRSHVWAS